MKHREQINFREIWSFHDEYLLNVEFDCWSECQISWKWNGKVQVLRGKNPGLCPLWSTLEVFKFSLKTSCKALVQNKRKVQKHNTCKNAFIYQARDENTDINNAIGVVSYAGQSGRRTPWFSFHSVVVGCWVGPGGGTGLYNICLWKDVCLWTGICICMHSWVYKLWVIMLIKYVCMRVHVGAHCK